MLRNKRLFMAIALIITLTLGTFAFSACNGYDGCCSDCGIEPPCPIAVQKDHLRATAFAATDFYLELMIEQNDLPANTTLEQLPITLNTLRVIYRVYAMGYAINDKAAFLTRFETHLSAAFADDTALHLASPAHLMVYANVLHTLGGNNPNRFDQAGSFLNTRLDSEEWFGEFELGAMLEFAVATEPSSPVMTRAQIIEHALKQQNADGGWGGWGSSADGTAMVLIGLSHHADAAGVTQAITDGKAFLIEERNAHGLNSAWGEISASSTALAMIALGDFDIDLLAYHFSYGDGGFVSDPDADFANPIFCTLDVLVAIHAFYLSL